MLLNLSQVRTEVSGDPSIWSPLLALARKRLAVLARSGMPFSDTSLSGANAEVLLQGGGTRPMSIKIAAGGIDLIRIRQDPYAAVISGFVSNWSLLPSRNNAPDAGANYFDWLTNKAGEDWIFHEAEDGSRQIINMHFADGLAYFADIDFSGLDSMISIRSAIPTERRGHVADKRKTAPDYSVGGFDSLFMADTSIYALTFNFDSSTLKRFNLKNGALDWGHTITENYTLFNVGQYAVMPISAQSATPHRDSLYYAALDDIQRLSMVNGHSLANLTGYDPPDAPLFGDLTHDGELPQGARTITFPGELFFSLLAVGDFMLLTRMHRGTDIVESAPSWGPVKNTDWRPTFKLSVLRADTLDVVYTVSGQSIGVGVDAAGYGFKSGTPRKVPFVAQSVKRLVIDSASVDAYAAIEWEYRENWLDYDGSVFSFRQGNRPLASQSDVLPRPGGVAGGGDYYRYMHHASG